MRVVFFLFFIFFSCSCKDKRTASDRVLEKQAHMDIVAEPKPMSVEEYDFSILWSSNSPMGYYDENEDMIRPEPIGYIGNDYQRFYIHFMSVEKNIKQPLEYLISGKTKVKNNICDFHGVINISQMQWQEPMEEFGDLNVRQGLITGTYTFREEEKQTGTGVFSGSFSTCFFINDKRKPYYDAIMIDADGFCNNQFEGIWRSYKTSYEKRCNWGDFRIPQSKDLDIGAGEFIPDEKYHSFGWENYEYLFDNSAEGEKAREAEEIKWWE